MSKEAKEFYVMVNGEKVIVSEEVYRAYVRPIRAEQKRNNRMWRCKMVKERNGKTRFIRCKQDCSQCQYALSGFNANGNSLSLNHLQEKGFEIIDDSIDIEEDYIKKEKALEDKKNLEEALSHLTERQRDLVRMVYFDGKSQKEIAQFFGVSKTAINNALKRIYDSLKKFLEKN